MPASSTSRDAGHSHASRRESAELLCSWAEDEQKGEIEKMITLTDHYHYLAPPRRSSVLFSARLRGSHDRIGSDRIARSGEQ